MSIFLIFIFFICLVISTSMYTHTDSILDNITFHRVKLGRYPFKDYWHLMKHLSRISLFLTGIIFGDIVIISILYNHTAAILLLAWLTCFPRLYQGWSKIALSTDEKYLLKDETIKISTGWDKLDKILGFHW